MKRLTWWLVAGVLGLGVVGALASSAWAEKAKEKGEAEEEKEVTLEQVPAAVKATILKEAGQAKVEKIEEETENGTTVYEAEWKADGKEVEIKVAADGTLLKKKVESEDEEKEGDDEEVEGGDESK